MPSIITKVMNRVSLCMDPVLLPNRNFRKLKTSFLVLNSNSIRDTVSQIPDKMMSTKVGLLKIPRLEHFIGVTTRGGRA